MSIIFFQKAMKLLLFSVLVASQQYDYYCKRPWPSLELFLPVYLGYGVKDLRRYEYEVLFLRSFLLFWPLKLSNTSLTVIYDAENESDDKRGLLNDMRETFLGVKERIPGGLRLLGSPPSSYYRSGQDRQQLMMFWADNYTTREYIGFVDTDAVIVTYVDREDLFEGDGRLPVVNARSGPHPYADGWHNMPSATFHILGILEPMRCMSYFPVIIRREHLVELRRYISAHHGGRPFDDIFFHELTGRSYCQFSIMCTFLFHFHRDEYKWYVHSVDPSWDGKSPPPNEGQDGNVSMFTAEMFAPKPRIATHARYRTSPATPEVNNKSNYAFFSIPKNNCIFADKMEQYH